MRFREKMRALAKKILKRVGTLFVHARASKVGRKYQPRKKPIRAKPVMLCTNAAYYPWRGGSEYVLQTIAEYMTRFFEVYVACPKIGRSFKEHNGVKIYEVNDTASFQEFVWDLQPDILFCNMVYNPINTENLDLYEHLDCFKIMNPVGGPYKLDEKWMASVLRRVGKIFDIYIHVDHNSTDYQRDTSYIPPEKIRIIPQGVHPEEFEDLPDKDTLRSKYGIKEQHYFMCGQTFWKWKNQVGLVQLFRDFPRSDVGLVLAGHSSFGDGSLDSVMKAAKTDPRVHFLPDLPRKDFLGLVKHSIAHVSRSKVEGPQPNIMLECGFMEVPYLTTSAGNRWTYPHVVVADPPEAFVDVMKNLSINTELCRKLGQAGHRYLMKIGASWGQVLRTYQELFLGERSLKDPRWQAAQKAEQTHWRSLWNGPEDALCIELRKKELTKQSFIVKHMEAALGVSLDALPTGSRVLDVGCGPFSYLSRMRFAGLKEGVDPLIFPDWVYEQYRENGFHVHIVPFENFNVCGVYDIILFYDALQHFGDLEVVARKCCKLLASDGAIYLSEYLNVPCDSAHIQFLTRNVLDGLFSRCGFCVLSNVVSVRLPSLVETGGDKPIDLYAAKATKERGDLLRGG
jgi:glycosyltransferase involved in cell wall biosynthesis/2-polyprenyl-3-methyl-5-hydroxy-6-metoxy-1,4-benzoquinol methylase